MPLGKPAGYLIDLDGTLLDGSRALPGAAVFLNTLQEARTEFLVMTNSIQSPDALSQRLNSVGLEVGPGRILNPIGAVNAYASSRGFRRIWAVGSAAEQVQVTGELDATNPELIALLDFEKENLDYRTLQMILEKMEAGCTAVAASPSPFYHKEGKKRLDTGAFVGLLEAASGRTIEILGKPAVAYFQLAAARLRREPAEITVVGDDWRTDIVGGRAAGMKTVLTAAGKYRKGDEDQGRPDRFLRSLEELISQGS